MKPFKSRNGSKSKMCTIPIPLMERFGKCDSLRFEAAENGVVTVKGA